MEGVIGRVVKSKAGRDKGRYFMILSVLDEAYVYLVDGDLRKIEKPKRKKLKHLNITNTILNEFLLKMDNQEPNLNSELKKIIISIANELY